MECPWRSARGDAALPPPGPRRARASSRMTRRAAQGIRSSALRRPTWRPTRSRMRPAQRRDVDDGHAAHGPRPRGDGAARGEWPRAPTLAAASASPTIPAPPSRSRPRPRPQLPRLAASRSWRSRGWRALHRRWSTRKVRGTSKRYMRPTLCYAPSTSISRGPLFAAGTPCAAAGAANVARLSLSSSNGAPPAAPARSSAVCVAAGSSCTNAPALFR